MKSKDPSVRRWSPVWGVVFSFLVVLGAPPVHAAGDEDREGTSHPNPLLRRLLTDGVRLDAETVVTPDRPRMTAAETAAGRREAVERAAGRYGWDAFVRPSVVAPFSLQISAVRSADDRRIGHRLDLAFVAYAELSDLRDRDLLTRIAESLRDREAAAEGGEVLGDQALADAGVETLRGPGVTQRFVSGSFALMDRVRVRGVIHVVEAFSEDSLSVVWELDERFGSTGDDRNVWQSIGRDRLGGREYGPEKPYRGHAGYIQATRLEEPAGALFIESWVVLHEPEAWFAGGNLLRSKLPVATQQSVRQLRRELAAER